MKLFLKPIRYHHDALQARGEPGSIYRCRPRDLIPAEDAPMSLHHIDFVQALKMAKLWETISNHGPSSLGWSPWKSAGKSA